MLRHEAVFHGWEAGRRPTGLKQKWRGELGCIKLETLGGAIADYEEGLFLSYIIQEANERIYAKEWVNETSMKMVAQLRGKERERVKVETHGLLLWFRKDSDFD